MRARALRRPLEDATAARRALWKAGTVRSSSTEPVRNATELPFTDVLGVVGYLLGLRDNRHGAPEFFVLGSVAGPIAAAYTWGLCRGIHPALRPGGRRLPLEPSGSYGSIAQLVLWAYSRRDGYVPVDTATWIPGTTFDRALLRMLLDQSGAEPIDPARISDEAMRRLAGKPPVAADGRVYAVQRINDRPAQMIASLLERLERGAAAVEMPVSTFTRVPWLDCTVRVPRRREMTGDRRPQGAPRPLGDDPAVLAPLHAAGIVTCARTDLAANEHEYGLTPAGCLPRGLATDERGRPLAAALDEAIRAEAHGMLGNSGPWHPRFADPIGGRRWMRCAVRDATLVVRVGAEGQPTAWRIVPREPLGRRRLTPALAALELHLSAQHAFVEAERDMQPAVQQRSVRMAPAREHRARLQVLGCQARGVLEGTRG